MSGSSAPMPGKADAFVVSCIDPRLTDDVTFLLAALGRTGRYSEMRIAGAALAVVDEGRPAWGTAVWENLAASRQLHGVRRVVFINHRDCGAMDLWAGRRLADDPAEELRQHHAVLNRAAAAVRARHPDMEVEIQLMELDGSTRILPCAACAPTQGLRADAVSPPEPVQGFAELVRLRATAGALDAEAERALLTEGVTRYGLSAEAARAALAAEAQRRGIASDSAAARDVRAFLRAQADARGRVARADVERAGELYRGVTGRQTTQAEAGRRVAALLEAEGLSPRPEGLLRSTTWHRQMAQA